MWEEYIFAIVFLSVCLSVFVSFRLFIIPCFHPCFCLSILVSVRLSLFPCFCPSILENKVLYVSFKKDCGKSLYNPYFEKNNFVSWENVHLKIKNYCICNTEAVKRKSRVNPVYFSRCIPCVYIYLNVKWKPELEADTLSLTSVVLQLPVKFPYIWKVCIKVNLEILVSTPYSYYFGKIHVSWCWVGSQTYTLTFLKWSFNLFGREFIKI